MSSLSPEGYAVIEGRHSDPFHYLGPHMENGVTRVRVFLPNAERVALVDEQGNETGLARIHEQGLFEGALANGAQRRKAHHNVAEPVDFLDKNARRLR